MIDFYSHWEREIFMALNQMVLGNIQRLEKQVFAQGRSRYDKKMLFSVAISLSAPEIVMAPSANDIYKMLVKFVKSIVEVCSQFYRWQNGSCLLAMSKINSREDESSVFTFYPELSGSTDILNSMVSLNHCITKTFTMLSNALDDWKRYRPLWKIDRNATMEKFALKKPHWLGYEEKLSFYTKISADVDSQAVCRDVGFVKLEFESLKSSVSSEARLWIKTIAKYLQDFAKNGVLEIKAGMAKHQEDISKSPETLDELTIVLNAINQARQASEYVNERCDDYEEVYRTLNMYKIYVTEPELEDSRSLRSSWETLLAKTRSVDAQLTVIKIKFAAATIQQVTQAIVY